MDGPCPVLDLGAMKHELVLLMTIQDSLGGFSSSPRNKIIGSSLTSPSKPNMCLGMIVNKDQQWLGVQELYHARVC
jgi:hypothetical protein